jgi:ectoine hydroxylase
MQLSSSQIECLHEDGFLVLPNLFSLEEVAMMRSAADLMFAEESPANISEKRSGKVRTAMGLHLRHEVFGKLVRHPRLVEPAMQLLGDRLYVQQVKINNKAAFDGEVWQWHYDFATHHGEDGVPEPLAVNLHVFLDDVVEFNGPLYFIPGSHKHGPAPTFLDTTTTSYPLWVVDRDTVSRLAAARGLFSATGSAGTGLIFCDCLVHGSPPNLSPWDRRIFSLIVNPISNAYTQTRRPDYKHHRDLRPITLLADDCLLAKPVVLTP